MNTKMLALILAGGQGTRLGKLTQSIAKPAVQFGGRYRIIDFALSNCANSGIDHVGVITQYQPLALNNHIGNGSAWGLEGIDAGATILQPYSASEGNKWFQGTSHAIFQNIDYIESVNPEYVLILSGDHIYKMDYDEMLQTHKKHDASLTVAVLDVPLKDASRFGIMNTDSDDRIIEFEEKPEQPKSTKASMGIYIFTWQRLKEMLVDAEKNGHNIEDFGQHVIPSYLDSGERVYTHQFSGYWKDVGTIESLWEANMEYIAENNPLDSRDRSWKIYSKNHIAPPNYIAQGAEVSDSLVVDGCYVSGQVEHSILSTNVQVQKGAVVKESFIMSGAIIGEGAHITKAIIGENAVIGSHTIIDGRDSIQVVGHGEVLGGSNEK